MEVELSAREIGRRLSEELMEDYDGQDNERTSLTEAGRLSSDLHQQGPPTKIQMENAEGAQELLSLAEILQLFAFSFANGVLISSYFIVTLPMESKLINMERRAMVLGGFVAVAGITQLVCPIVGLYSDRCQHEWGKRRPFIFYGGLAGCLGLFAQGVCHTQQWWWWYLLFFTVSMLALNVIFSAMVGLIADFVPTDQTGKANGVIAMLSVTGAISSFGVFQLLQGNLTRFYGFYILCLFTTCTLTFRGANRQYQSVKMNVHAVSWEDIKNSFYLDPVEHHDFFLILISRTLYYMGVSSQTFLMYYLRDRLGISENDAESYTAVLAVVGQSAAVVTALPAGYLSDMLGSGRKKFIYLSCLVLALGNIGLIGSSSKTAIFVVTCIIGMGNGVYLTSDASLAIDALPNKEEAARFMGIWGVGAFVGTALGPMIGGPFLAYNSMEKEDTDGSTFLAYSMVGYAVLLGVSALYFFGSACVLHWVHVR